MRWGERIRRFFESKPKPLEPLRPGVFVRHRLMDSGKMLIAKRRFTPGVLGPGTEQSDGFDVRRSDGSIVYLMDCEIEPWP